jgi:hypothetical protein
MLCCSSAYGSWFCILNIQEADERERGREREREREKNENMGNEVKGKRGE